MFPTIDKERTGARIRNLMKQQNITVRQIQEYLNLSCVQGIYHWLDGTSMLTVDNLYALSELFKVPLDSIVCGNRKYNVTRNLNDFNTRMIEYYTRIVKTAQQLFYTTSPMTLHEFSFRIIYTNNFKGGFFYE